MVEEETPPIPEGCFDGVMNQDETEVDCGGTCPVCTVASSCQDLLAQTPQSPSGIYRIDPDGDGPGEPSFAYCDMVGEGGGWTLAMKLDGTRDTFLYGSALWTSTNTYNENSPNLDRTEAKLAVFNALSFSEIRVGMMYNDELRWIRIDYAANSLLSIFQTDSLTSITVPKSDWLSLLSNSLLQANCNRTGFNVRSGPLANDVVGVRLGIIANNEADCGSPDSFIGLGYTGFMPGCETTIFLTTKTGNGSTCTTPADTRNTAAYGYLMVR
jgi:hypothetical protein